MKFRPLALLFFCPVSSVAMMDIDEPPTTGLRDTAIVNASHPAYFKSPDRISCQCPSLVVFHHEDIYPSVEKGNYGEKQLKRTVKKFAAIKKGMDLYKNNDKSDKGYDFVLVDHEWKLVTFLEAKSSDVSTMRGKKPSKKKQQECEDLLLNPEMQVSREMIKTHLQSHLGKKDVDQLSRKWCYKCSSKTVKLDSSFKKDLTEDQPLFNLKDLIEKKDYKFMRLASFTIVTSKEDTGDVSTLPTVTYYSITQDGDSTTSASEVKKKDIIVNAGLEFLWDEQELALPQAKEYLNHIYKALFKNRYHILFIDTPPSVSAPLLSPSTGVISKKGHKKKEEMDTLEVIKGKTTSLSTPVKNISLPTPKRERPDENLAEGDKSNFSKEHQKQKKVKISEDAGEKKEPNSTQNSKKSGEKEKTKKKNPKKNDPSNKKPEKSLAYLAKKRGFDLGDLNDDMEIARFILAKVHWCSDAGAQELADSLEVSTSTYYSFRNKKGSSPTILSAIKSSLKDKKSIFYKFAQQSLQEEKSIKSSVDNAPNEDIKKPAENLASLAQEIGFGTEGLQDENKIAKLILKRLCGYRNGLPIDNGDHNYVDALEKKIKTSLDVSDSTFSFFLNEDYHSPIMVSAIKAALIKKDSTFYEMLVKFLFSEDLLTEDEINSIPGKTYNPYHNAIELT